MVIFETSAWGPSHAFAFVTLPEVEEAIAIAQRAQVEVAGRSVAVRLPGVPGKSRLCCICLSNNAKQFESMKVLTVRTALM